MLFSRDGIPNPFQKTVQQVDKMVNPNGKDVINDPGSVKHTLEGAGMLDSSVTSKKFGGLDDRGTEFNFLSLHINTMTTMSMIGLTALFIELLLYCSSKQCCGDIWRAMTCCRCTMVPRHNQSTYELSTSIGSAHHLAINAASAPTQGEMESLENTQYLILAKQKKRPKMDADKNADFNEGDQKCG